MIFSPRSHAGRRVLGSLALVVLVVVACQTPTTHEVNMGQQVHVSWDSHPGRENARDLMQNVRALPGVEDVSSKFIDTPDGTAKLELFVWGQGIEPSQLQKVVGQYAGDPDHYRVEIQDLDGTVRESLGQRLGRGIFNLDIEGATAEEIRQQILAEFRARGLEGDAVVDLQTDGDTKTITIDAKAIGGEGEERSESEDQLILEIKEKDQ